MSLIHKLLGISDARRAQSAICRLEEQVREIRKSRKQESEKWKKLESELSRLARGLAGVMPQVELLAREVETLKGISGNMAARRVRSLPAETPFHEVEFRVSSQWGEDGILQFLLAHVPVENEIFVEFGVESYREANTRFLLENNGWKGLIIDGSGEAMEAVRQSDLAWRHTLHARAAWVTAENINELISSAGFQGDIGLLSVDIDGVDYWVWRAVSVVRPRIVIAEFNALFGPVAQVTTPYIADFQRSKAHPSHLFYGLSLAAAESLGRELGYRLVGVNTAANNAFFVREDLSGPFPAASARELWRPSRFREARNTDGTLAFPSFGEARQLIGDCVVYDLRQARELPLREVPDWLSDS